MTPNNLPQEVDRDKLAEVALAILSLTLHDGGRVWKGLDWDLMDLLHEKGWVVDPRSKAKSVVLTEDGERLAHEFLQRHFSSRRARQPSRYEGSRAGVVQFREPAGQPGAAADVPDRSEQTAPPRVARLSARGQAARVAAGSDDDSAIRPSQ